MNAYIDRESRKLLAVSGHEVYLDTHETHEFVGRDDQGNAIPGPNPNYGRLIVYRWTGMVENPGVDKREVYQWLPDGPYFVDVNRVKSFVKQEELNQWLAELAGKYVREAYDLAVAKKAEKEARMAVRSDS